MVSPLKQIFFPVSFTELFAIWGRFPAAKIYAGGTNIYHNYHRRKKNQSFTEDQNTEPLIFLCLDKIEELQSITRTEQYLEIGAMVKLNSLVYLGKTVPYVLCKCIENIAGIQVKNLATVGGNICIKPQLPDLPVPLIALDAQYEIRNTQSSRWVSAARFHSKTEDSSLKNQELLTRIRLPLYQWDYSYYKKFYREELFYSETLVFLAKTPKNTLSEIRIIYKNNEILRNKDGETILNGKSLPLDKKSANEFMENWRQFLEQKHDITEFARSALLHCIEENIYNLFE